MSNTLEFIIDSGLKGAVREVAGQISANTFVCRTDVKGYDASINHDKLYQLVKCHVDEKQVLALVWQYLTRHLVWWQLYRHQRHIVGLPTVSIDGRVVPEAVG